MHRYIQNDFIRKYLSSRRGKLTLSVVFLLVILITLSNDSSVFLKNIKLPLKMEIKNDAFGNSGEDCKQYTTVKGDSLYLIFSKENISNRYAHIISTKDKRKKVLRNISPNDSFIFCQKTNGIDNILTKLDYSKDKGRFKYSFVNKGKDKFEFRKKKVATVTYNNLFKIEIKKSFYMDALESGMNDNEIMLFVDIFQWDIDFLRGIHKGDIAYVWIQTTYKKDGSESGKKIIAASYTKKTNNSSNIAYRFEKNNVLVGFFDEKGKSKQKRFLRYPVKFTRISSKFDMHRVHPLFKTVRPHRGVDYAARRGTRVVSVSKGIVKFKGRMRGYGNVIILNHGHGYSTLYAHLNGFNRRIRKGSRVVQNQVIGYVGSTGYATGPHLHYEFRIHGRHRNPLTVRLPGKQSISRRKMPNFLYKIAKIKHEFNLRKNMLDD